MADSTPAQVILPNSSPGGGYVVSVTTDRGSTQKKQPVVPSQMCRDFTRTSRSLSICAAYRRAPTFSVLPFREIQLRISYPTDGAVTWYSVYSVAGLSKIQTCEQDRGLRSRRGKMIASMGILRATSNLYDQPTFYQRSKTSSSCSGGELNSFGNLRSGETRFRILGQCREDHFVSSVFGWDSADDRREGHAKMRANLLEVRYVEPAVPAGRSHALDTASPLFDQSEFLKYSADDSVAEF